MIIHGKESWEVRRIGELEEHRWHVVYDDPQQAKQAFAVLGKDVVDRLVNKQQWGLRTALKIREERSFETEKTLFIVHVRLIHSKTPIDGFNIKTENERSVRGFVIS